MVTRTVFLTAAILACLPMVAFGQAKKATAKAEVPCCGQALTADESPQQMRLETQQNLQAVLMARTGAKRLAAGDYLISESAEGYEFRALVSRQGIVDGWYVADLDGMPIALINSNGNGTQSGGGYNCFIKYGQAVSACANVNVQFERPHRYEECIDHAWDSLIGCLNGTSGGVIIR